MKRSIVKILVLCFLKGKIKFGSVLNFVLTGVCVLCDILSPIIIGKSLDVISEPKIDINMLILLFALEQHY